MWERGETPGDKDALRKREGGMCVGRKREEGGGMFAQRGRYNARAVLVDTQALAELGGSLSAILPLPLPRPFMPPSHLHQSCKSFFALLASFHCRKPTRSLCASPLCPNRSSSAVTRLTYRVGERHSLSTRSSDAVNRCTSNEQGEEMGDGGQKVAVPTLRKVQTSP